MSGCVKITREFERLAHNLMLPVGTLEGQQLSVLLKTINDGFARVVSLANQKVRQRDESIKILIEKLAAANTKVSDLEDEIYNMEMAEYGDDL